MQIRNVKIEKNLTPAEVAAYKPALIYFQSVQSYDPSTGDAVFNLINPIENKVPDPKATAQDATLVAEDLKAALVQIQDALAKL